jgi:ferredoxin
MIFEKYYISKEHWQKALLDWMQEYDVFAPIWHPGGLFYQRADASLIHSFVLDAARTVQPLKPFFFPAFEDISQDFREGTQSRLILGVRACDLKALDLLDRILGIGLQDPRYIGRRKNSVIVGADCTQPYPTCFCTLEDGAPFATEGFDLNVSKVWDGFVVEVGSPRGNALLEGFDRSLKPLVKEEEDAQEKLRRETAQKVRKINQNYTTRPSHAERVQSGWDSPVWENQSATCVECGACNFACPTDCSGQTESGVKKSSPKTRSWDACLLAGFEGGARPRLSDRFRHRFFEKYLRLPESYKIPGCTGCGRCIEACPGRIDMRSVLMDLVKGQKSTTAKQAAV